MRSIMWLGLAAAFCQKFRSVAAAPFTSDTDLQYEYIVVGSGAGGGPLAARLAEAGKSVLLIEAGNDQGNNLNYTIPVFQGASTQDEKMRWDVYVSHYQDVERAQKDPKYVYDTPLGEYVGLSPPSGATPKGILYPRAGTLGGCTSHNALIWILPHASDWNNVAHLTGDASWSYESMLQYYSKVYEWQPAQPAYPGTIVRDLMLYDHLAGGATALGIGPDPNKTAPGDLQGLLGNDPNNVALSDRDSTEGFFHIPLSMKDGRRISVRDRLINVANKHPNLTIRQNCLVTKVIFDDSIMPPKAVGVEFLDGPYLYRASPLCGGQGLPGRALASKEVVLAGGSFNTPQLLKLSGIGPADELNSFGIPVVHNLPGVGTNMQDRYEIPVNVKHGEHFTFSDNCTFDGQDHDLCYKQWVDNPYSLPLQGVYATNSLAAAMVKRSKAADNSDVDLFISGGPVNFQGYFPLWDLVAGQDQKHFSWFALKAHTRNKAGTVKLSSADPRDQPRIDFNYFDTGTTSDCEDQKDLAALVEAISLSREALKQYYNFADQPLLKGDEFAEENPGTDVASKEQLEDYVKTHAWGHHASCSCAIGADNDPMAVLDSAFRVRGVQSLRVVDASAFPKIPGTFIQAPIFIMSEKAADVILNCK